MKLKIVFLFACLLFLSCLGRYVKERKFIGIVSNFSYQSKSGLFYPGMGVEIDFNNGKKMATTLYEPVIVGDSVFVWRDDVHCER